MARTRVSKWAGPVLWLLVSGILMYEADQRAHRWPVLGAHRQSHIDLTLPALPSDWL